MSWDIPMSLLIFILASAYCCFFFPFFTLIYHDFIPISVREQLEFRWIFQPELIALFFMYNSDLPDFSTGQLLSHREWFLTNQVKPAIRKIEQIILDFSFFTLYLWFYHFSSYSQTSFGVQLYLWFFSYIFQIFLLFWT